MLYIIEGFTEEQNKELNHLIDITFPRVDKSKICCVKLLRCHPEIKILEITLRDEIKAVIISEIILGWLYQKHIILV